MINNFQRIENLLQFENEGDFYFLQILKRRKDNPTMERDMMVINNYFINSLEDLEYQKSHIIDECTFHNARAYIRINVRNYKKLGLLTMKKITEYMISGDYKAIRNAWLSTAGENHCQNPKRWIVDIDVKDLSMVKQYMDMIEARQPVGNKIQALIPTKNGFHIITHPFNLQEWSKLIKDPIQSVDIHKDNPTILYIP